MAGDNDTGRGDKGRSCACLFVGTAEAFSLARDENTEREEHGVLGEGISLTGEEILGNAYLGEGVLCKYGGDKRRSNTRIYKKATGRRRKGRTAKIMERQQRMTLSGVVVPRKPPTRSVVVYCLNMCSSKNSLFLDINVKSWSIILI